LPLAALALILLSGLIHASWNLLAKRAAAGSDFVLLFAALSCVVYAPAAIFLWPAMPAHLPAMAWFAIALSGVVHLLYALCLQRGYQAAELGLVYPIARGTGPMLASLGAIAVLGERLTLTTLTGLLLIVAGIVSLTRQSAGSLDPARTLTGVGYGLLTGVLIALYTLTDAWSVRLAQIPPLLLDYFSNAIRTLLLMPIMVGRWTQLRTAARDHGRAAFGVALLSPLSYILALTALQMAPVARVAPAREISLLFGVLFGAFFLGEKLTAAKVFGAISIAGGVLVLA
jgi:drug/metabolite transporter (DMT)-like permease